VSEEAPKSAFELAMERLRRKDAEEGVVERPLSEEQKAQIAELRRVYEARLAEREILHRSKLAGTLDPAAREALEDEYRRDRERLNDERERKIAEVHREG
jgi:hypothetical protein